MPSPGTSIQVYVRDTTTGAIVLASVSTSGAVADQACVFPMISGDGRFVVFRTLASNLVSGVTITERQL